MIYSSIDIYMYTMFVKIATPWKNSQKLMKFTLYISHSSTNERSNLQNKKKQKERRKSVLYVSGMLSDESLYTS